MQRHLLWFDGKNLRLKIVGPICDIFEAESWCFCVELLIRLTTSNKAHAFKKEKFDFC